MAVVDDYYPELVLKLLECGEDQNPFVLLVDEKRSDPRQDEDLDYRLPHVSVMFPKGSRMHEMESFDWATRGQDSQDFGTSYEQSSLSTLVEDEKAICLILPLLNALSTVSDSQTRDLQEAFLWKPLSLLLSVMAEDAKLLMPVPIRFLQMPGLAAKRLKLFSNHQALVIEHRHPFSGIRFRMGGLSGDNMATIVFSKKAGKAIFFKLLQPEIQTLKSQLPLLQSGKKPVTSCGFVCSEELRPDKPTLFDSYSPGRDTKIVEGRTLREIADIEKGPSLSKNEHGEHKCFTSKCISGELMPDLGKMDRVNSKGAESMLQHGDLVMDAATDINGRLRVSLLENVPERIMFDESVIRIRFKDGMSEDVHELIKSILLSPAAANLLFPSGLETLHDLDPEWLRDLRMPIEEDLIREYLRIHEMRFEFAQLIDRTDQLLQGLLWEETAEGIRKRIQFGDGELRLIHDAARAVRNPDHRITRYYPRPLSLVWAEYRKSTTADIQARHECMAKARKAGETLVAFMALLAASYAHKYGTNVMAGWRLCRVNDEGKKGKKGYDFGTWVATLTAACNKAKGKVTAHSPISDLVSLMDDPVWNQALKGLISIRNSDSHLRVSEPELAKKVMDADAFLGTLFNKVSFLINWSLRIVDVAKYDPHRDLSTLCYREVHGSGLHMETRKCLVPGNRIGPGLLYLVNRIGEPEWHLLDPFIKLLECPQHRFESVFHLDSLPDKPIRPDDVVLKSFEFNSTLLTNEFNEVFTECGMLGNVT